MPAEDPGAGEERCLPPPLPSELPPGASPSSAPGPPAAWWAWPAILISVFFIGWSVNLFEPKLREEGSDGEPPSRQAEEAARTQRASDLALFKIQTQVVIATSALGKPGSGKALQELRSQASGARMLAALALVMSFVGEPDSEILRTLDRLPPSTPEPLERLARRAVTEGIGDEERAELAEELGWFASLARGEGLAESPEAGRIRTKAFSTLGIVGFVFLGALAGILVGGALLFWLMRQRRIDPSTFAFSSAHGPQGLLLECFALYLGIMALGELLGRFLDPSFAMASYAVSMVVPFLWPKARGVRWRDFARSMGLHRGKGVMRELRAGAAGYLAVLAIASVGIFLTLILSHFAGMAGAAENGAGAPGSPSPQRSGPETHPIVGWIYAGSFLERLLCLFLAAVIAPVFEEIFFRGALHRYFRGRFRFFASALLTGLIFAALHPQGWMGIPALAAIGIGFSLLREWRDSLIAPMVGHAINNGVLVTMLWIVL